MIGVGFALGDEITQKGLEGRQFIYRLVEIEPYTRRNGASSAILTWESHCAICHDPFTVKSGRKPGRYLVRTCPADRKTRREFWAREVPRV